MIGSYEKSGSPGKYICVTRRVASDGPAFAGMLRTRRGRDLAALIIALLGISCGPLQQVLFAFVARGDDEWDGVATGQV